MEPEISILKNKKNWYEVQLLLKTTPLSSTLPLAVARTDNLNLSYPKLSGASLDLIATNNDDLLGFVHGRIEKRYLKSKEEEIAYFGDFRINSNYRRQGLASKMGMAMLAQLTETSNHYGYGLIVKGNEPIFQVLFKNQKKTEKNSDIQTAGEYKVASRLLLKRPKTLSSSSYEHFEPSLEAFSNYIDNVKNHFLGPQISAEDLMAFYKLYPEIRFYQNCQKPGLIAFALWEQSRFRQLLFTKMPLAFKALSLAWNGLRPFTKAHPFPKVGTPWKSAEVCFTNENIFTEDFEAFVCHEAWQMGCHTFNVIESGLNQKDRVKIKGPCYRMDLKVIVFGFNDHPAPVPSEHQPVHVDLGFV